MYDGFYFTEERAREVSKQFRYPGRVKITLDVSPELDNLYFHAEGNLEATWLSNPQVVNHTSPAANLEGLWHADGRTALLSRLPEENQIDLWSEAAVSEESPLTLTYSLSPVSSIAGITLTWDYNHASYPTKFTLVALDSYSTEIKELVVTNTSPVPFPFTQAVEFPVDDCARIKIIITEWSKPDQRARVEGMHVGIVLSLSEHQVVSISEQTQQDFVCAKLPVDTHKYVIRNLVYRKVPAEIMGYSYNGASTVLPWLPESATSAENEPLTLLVTLKQPAKLSSAHVTWNLDAHTYPSRISISGLDSFNQTVYTEYFNPSSVDSQFDLPRKTVAALRVNVLEYLDGIAINAIDLQQEYGSNSIPSEVNNLFDPLMLTGISKYMSQRQKVEVTYGIDTYSGQTLWWPYQTRYLDSWEIPLDKSVVELQSSTRLSFLTGIYTSGHYYAPTASLRDLADSVLSSSNIIKDSPTQTPWYFSSVLSECYTDAPLPMLAENALLQLIAQAAGCRLCSAPVDDRVCIYDAVQDDLDAWQDTPYIIGPDTQLQQPSVSLETPLRSIQIYQYKYTPETTESVLYETSMRVLNGTYTYEFFYADGVCATDITVEVTNSTIILQKSDGYKTKLILQHIGGPKTITVRITGHKVTSSKELITVYADSAVNSGKDVVVDNPLVTNSALLSRVSSAMKRHYLRRKNVSTKYLGYPDIKSGSRLAVYSDFVNGFGSVVESRFEYNGAFSGNLKVLMEE